MSDARERAPKSPWSFVPTLYTLQGLAYFTVNVAANTYFTVLGLPLDAIARYTSDLALPWMLKPLWSPFVDLYGTKRRWLLGSALLVVLAIVALAWAVTTREPVEHVVLACVVLAVAGATNDIATDGFYILALRKHDQEFFVGVRSAAFRLGRIAAVGGAVRLVGVFMKHGSDAARAWNFAFLACAALYALATAWHLAWLPCPADDGPSRRASGGWSAFVESLRAYVGKPGIAGAIAFILVYRLAESLLTPMIQPFLLRPASEGGAALTIDDSSSLYGTYGVIALVVGGLLGGACIARFGLRRCLWPMALAMHAPNVLYAWAASAHFGLLGVGLVVGVEQCGYGIGFAAYTAALLEFSRGTRFATTHYALSTGLMALSAWISGRYSGALAEVLGFERFFWTVSAIGVLGLATLPFFPCDRSSASPRTGGG